MNEDNSVPPVAFEEVVETSESCNNQANKSNVKAFSASESYNGAEFEKYCWSQTDSEIGMIYSLKF
jgi:hypothetical protein